MLVVSNIDLETTIPAMKQSAFLKSSIKGSTINIANDYRYLKTGYYVSIHAEILGNDVIPTSQNIIDANRTPILLLKAKKEGIPAMPYILTSSIKQIMTEMEFPLVAFAVNPAMFEGYRIASNRSALYRAVKSLSMNYKFAVCAQPLLGEIVSFKSFFGKSQQDYKLAEIARSVYKVFRIPICKLHVQRTEERAYLSGLQPLKKEEILPSDLKIISDEVSRMGREG